ncbi:MAG: NUDIX domain-containing protein [Siculibacillus sp.]|nr:NUDIX domain-containing protein [Siculibacillus sp.]
MPLITLAKPLVKRIGALVGVLTRATTLGVRGIVRDDDGRVLLVRHTYLPGWYLPGGGVDPGETAAAAVIREIVEETGVTPVGDPRLLGLYLNRRVSLRDHVALFVFDFSAGRQEPRRPPFEIAEVGFFGLDALPDETTAATRRRLAEIRGDAPVAAEW